MKTNVFWGLAVAILVGLFAWYLFNTPAASVQTPSSAVSGGHTITLTKDGFVPDTVTIKKGDTITFKTTTGNMFWPASNLHPSHLLYPEFDPKEPVQPDASWSFTFDKVGKWQFHDHLAPYFTGTITVIE